MKDTLIIYDSVFGNTGKIAQEMARILGEHQEVDLRQVGEVWPEHLDGIKTLIQSYQRIESVFKTNSRW